MEKRTVAEIVSRIRDLESTDWLGFQRSDLMQFLPFDAAKEFLKSDAASEGWECLDPTKEIIEAKILDYMKFAWGKANDCRGLSAGRSMNHMQAYLWLLGEDDVVPELDHYSFYGKAHLAAICEHFGLGWEQFDDGIWKDDERDSGGYPRGPSSLSWKS